MKVKLTEPHVIGDAVRPRGTIIELPANHQPTPLMVGLDEEAVAAIEYQKLKVWGRYWWPPGLYPPGAGGAQPLDDPPIPRPIDDNQPVYHYTGSNEYLS